MSSHSLLNVNDRVMIWWRVVPMPLFFGLSGKCCLRIKVILNLQNVVVSIFPGMRHACLKFLLIWLLMWGPVWCWCGRWVGSGTPSTSDLAAFGTGFGAGAIELRLGSQKRLWSSLLGCQMLRADLTVCLLLILIFWAHHFSDVYVLHPTFRSSS